MLGKKNKRAKKPLSLRMVFVLSILVFALSSFVFYCFSEDSKVRVLACEGNYYYSDSQIYEMAKVSTNTRLWLLPSSVIESRVDKQDLISSVKIEKSNGSLVIRIKEKLAIGYYIEKNEYYILTIDNESIKVDEKYKSNLIHLPFIHDLSKEQRKEMCASFSKDKENLSREIIEKISEICPFESSYDSNMIKMVMRDGNAVYSNMDSLYMLAKYNAVLTQLKGTSVCLLLDSEHLAIDKINCSDITTNRKALQAKVKACEEDGGHWDTEEDVCRHGRKDDDEDDDSEDGEEDGEEDGDLNDRPVDPNSTTPFLDSISDWAYDEVSGWYYSESTGYYLSPYTEEYYRLDPNTGGVVKMTSDPE